MRLGLALAALGAALLSLPPASGSGSAFCQFDTDRSWDGGGNGTSWHDPLNWAPNGLPQPDEIVCIEDEGSPTVVISEGTQTVASIESFGSLVISGGALEITDTSRTSPVTTLTLSGSGTLGGAATVLIQGLTEWFGGTMTGSGTTIIDNGGIVTIEAPGSTVDLRGGRTLRMNGELIWTDGDIRSGEGALWEIQGDFLVGLDADHSWTSDLGGAPSRVHVLGTIGVNANGVATIAVELDNDGIAFSGGAGSTLALTGGDGTGVSSGRFSGLAGGVVNFSDGTFDLEDALVSGRVGIEGTAVVNIEGAVDAFNQGSISLADDAVLQGSGTLTLSGHSEWTGGHMAGGTTVIAPGGSLTMNASPGEFLHLRGHTLRVEGAATWQGGGIKSGQSALVDVLGTFTIATDGLWDFNYGDTRASLEVHSGGSLAKSAGTGETTLDAGVSNAGALSVENGTLSLAGPDGFENAGRLNVESGSTFVSPQTVTNTGLLEGNGTVSTSESVTSSGEVAPGASPGVLTIDGDYVQMADGRLRIEIAGESPGAEYDRLAILGDAGIDGTLTIETASGFTPPLGAGFDVVTGTRSGEFAVIEGANLPGDLLYRAHYGPSSVRLVVEPALPPPPPPPPASAAASTPRLHLRLRLRRLHLRRRLHPHRPPPPPPPRRVCRVPNVVGKQIRRARTLIGRSGCRMGTIRRARSRRKAGTVVSQRPVAGRRVPLRTRVRLVVSSSRR